MTTPELLAEILKLFPGLGVGLVIAWYSVRVLRSVHATQEQRVQDDHARHLQTKDGVIARLDAEIAALRKERDKWLREVMKKEKP